MPDLNNRFLEGNGTGYIEAGLPNITGNFYPSIGWEKTVSSYNTYTEGVFSVNDTRVLSHHISGNNGGNNYTCLKFDAS